MRRLVTTLALPLPVYLLLTACGTAPIPNVAVEGTTVAIAIPGAFEMGYGRATFGTSIDPLSAGDGGSFDGPPLNAGSLTNEDMQRGELVARLLEGSTPIATLPVRYVTRVAADPASALGRGVGSWPTQQKLVWVDIPLRRFSTAPLVSDGTRQQAFAIEVRRFRRSNLLSGATTFTEIPQSFFAPNRWVGWGNETSSNPMTPIPIEIRDADGDDGNEAAKFTPFNGWDASIVPGYFSGVGMITNLNGSLAVPDPEFRVQLAPPQGTSLPGAWVVELTYAAQKMVITGVTMSRSSQSAGSGYVSYSTLPGGSPPPCSSTPVTRNLRISVVDPDALATGVKVAYALKSDVVNCGAGVTKVESGDVVINPAQTMAYNLSGVPVNILVSVVTNDFN